MCPWFPAGALAAERLDILDEPRFSDQAIGMVLQRFEAAFKERIFLCVGPAAAQAWLRGWTVSVSLTRSAQ
jgi:hypothetical protein